MRPNETTGSRSENEKSKVALRSLAYFHIRPALDRPTKRRISFCRIARPHASFALSLGCVLLTSKTIRLLFLDNFCLPYKALGIIYIFS